MKKIDGTGRGTPSGRSNDGRRLALRRELLRDLTVRELAGVAGRGMDTRCASGSDPSTLITNYTCDVG